MTPAVKTGAFAGGLAVIFAAALIIGMGIDSNETRTSSGASHRAMESETNSPDSHHVPNSTATTSETASPPGLAVTQDGYTLVPRAEELPRGSGVPFRFTITGPDGAPVRDYRIEHEKELHLIVVRRDFAAFQHVHPVREADGGWKVPLDLVAAGAYRVFADFTPAALGRGLTLGTDVAVGGTFEPAALPRATSKAVVDGYEVSVSGAPIAGQPSTLTFTVTKNGAKVTDLEPYLGAFGHLVSLRVGDLAYLHTHPGDEAAAGDLGGPRVRFTTEFPTAGRYRLFLDFKHAGQVHTAAFTMTVDGPATSAAAITMSPGTHSDTGHGH